MSDDDLVQALRIAQKHGPSGGAAVLHKEAADEIERLAAENERLREIILGAVNSVQTRTDGQISGLDYTRMREALELLGGPDLIEHRSNYDYGLTPTD